jgi:hypothetical protein
MKSGRGRGGSNIMVVQKPAISPHILWSYKDSPILPSLLWVWTLLKNFRSCFIGKLLHYCECYNGGEGGGFVREHMLLDLSRTFISLLKMLCFKDKSRWMKMMLLGRDLSSSGVIPCEKRM